MIFKNDTITAVATAPGAGGIGIIRLSGTEAVKIAQDLFRSSAETASTPIDPQAISAAYQFQHRKMHYGSIVDPHTLQVVDEVLVAFMRAPHSYTREDVIEIQSHAGSAVLLAILRLVTQAGARLAEPGEFTRRAFLNGRIDLTQAEAVADIIEAKTDQALKLASHQLAGGMTERVASVRRLLEKTAAHLEAAIEFPEEIQDADDFRFAFRKDTTKTLQMLEALIRAHEESHLFRDGIQVSVVGKPNVGKSSLLNALVQRERAIVTALPGTTRDVVTDGFQVEGIPFEIADTAGMRKSDDLIEKIGIQKTEESIAQAQLILFVMDASDDNDRDDQEIYAQIQDKRVLLVMNKSDLVESEPAKPAWVAPRLPSVVISAKYAHNIESLKKRMVELVAGERPIATHQIVPNLRQKNAFDRAYADVTNARDAERRGESEEFIVFHLQSALNGLGTITGETYTEDLLDIIFKRFCIGK